MSYSGYIPNQRTDPAVLSLGNPGGCTSKEPNIAPSVESWRATPRGILIRPRSGGLGSGGLGCGGLGCGAHLKFGGDCLQNVDDSTDCGFRILECFECRTKSSPLLVLH